MNYSLVEAIAEMHEQSCDTLMLSSEDFLQSTFYGGFMESFFSELRRSFDKVVVTAYVRNRKDFFTSSYNHWVKSLMYPKSFTCYLKQIVDDQRPPIRYTRALTCWGQYADESIYLPFLPKTFSRPVEHEFLIRNGFSDKDVGMFVDVGGELANASIGPLSVVAFRQLTGKLLATNWYEPHLIAKRGRLVNAALADSNTLGWNKVGFRVCNQENLTVILREFGSDDATFSDQFFRRGWQEVFPDEAIADQCTELFYDHLSATNRREVDSFVVRNANLARKAYISAGAV